MSSAVRNGREYFITRLIDRFHAAHNRKLNLFILQCVIWLAPELYDDYAT